jgi:hypothetical protein
LTINGRMSGAYVSKSIMSEIRGAECGAPSELSHRQRSARLDFS